MRAPEMMTTRFNETDLSQLPLQFEANAGQADAAARFLARGPGYNVFLISDEALLALRAAEPGHSPAVLRLQFVGAAEPQVTGSSELSGIVDYYLGRDPSQWHAGIPTYRKILYQGICPGIDLLFYGNEGRLGGLCRQYQRLGTKPGFQGIPADRDPVEQPIVLGNWATIHVHRRPQAVKASKGE